MNTAYPAIIERATGGFGVYFPDLPGCTSAGATIDQAVLNAAEALSGHLSVMLDYGEALPPASILETIERDADVDEVARVMVPADVSEDVGTATPAHSPCVHFGA